MLCWKIILLCLVAPLPLRAAEAAASAHMVWDFEGGIMNRWGGRYNTYKRAPSWVRTYLDPGHGRGGKGYALRVTAHREAEGFGGVWLDLGSDAQAPPRTYDASAMRYLGFWARGTKGGEDFEISLSDLANADRDERPFRRLRAYLPGGLTTAWRQVLIPLADFQDLDKRHLLRLTLKLTRPGDSRFYLDDIGFQRTASTPPAPKGSARVKSPASPDAPRAMWAWSTKPLFDPDQPQEADRFLAFCAEQNIRTVYLAAEFDRTGDESSLDRQMRDPDGYRAFLERAHQQGLRVEALAGTPEWALRANHLQALAALDAIIRFNHGSQPAGRFDGIHLDVEPYSLLGYSDPGLRGEILLGLVEMAEKCRERSHAAGLTFSCDLPSWFYASGGLERNGLIVNFKGEGKTAGEHLTDLADSITIMDYTNQADGAGGIIARALPALQYAASRGKKVVVGVETFQEHDSTVSFVLGLPAKEFWSRLARSNLWGVHRFEDYRVALLADDANVHLGLSTPHPMTPAERVAFEGALARLAAQFGASADPERYHPFEMLELARAAVNENPDWEGFEPFEFTDPQSGKLIQGFRRTYRMQPQITFHGLSRETFEEEIASTVEWLSPHPSFGGVAVHFYDSFRELIEGGKANSAAGSEKADSKGK